MSKLGVVLKTTLSTPLEEERYVDQKTICYEFLHFTKVQVFLRYKTWKIHSFRSLGYHDESYPFYTMAQLKELLLLMHRCTVVVCVWLQLVKQAKPEMII